MSTLLSEENSFHTQDAVQLLILLAVINVLFAINSELFRSLSFFPETTPFVGSCRPWNNAVLASLALWASSGGAVRSVLLCQDAARGAKQHRRCASMLLSGCIDFRRPRGPIASPWPRLRKAGRDEWEWRKKKDDRVDLPTSQLQKMSENNLKWFFFLNKNLPLWK